MVKQMQKWACRFVKTTICKKSRNQVTGPKSLPLLAYNHPKIELTAKRAPVGEFLNLLIFQQ
jgi:hypothetical protein